MINLGKILIKKSYNCKNKDCLDSYHFLYLYKTKDFNIFDELQREEANKLQMKLNNIALRLITINKAFRNFMLLKDIEIDDCITLDIQDRLKKNTIPQDKLSNYAEIKLFIDIIIKILNTALRNYYSNKTFSHSKKLFLKYETKTKEKDEVILTKVINSKNDEISKNISKKELKRKIKLDKEKELQEQRAKEKKQKEVNVDIRQHLDVIYKNMSLKIFCSLLTFNLFYLKKYHILADPDDFKEGKINFVSFIIAYIENEKAVKLNFAKLDNLYQKFTDKDSKLSLQVSQYMEQISLYLVLIEHISEKLRVNTSLFLSSRDNYVSNDKDTYTLITLKYIYIYLKPQENISDVQINVIIAFLNQMESFYYNKLHYIISKLDD